MRAGPERLIIAFLCSGLMVPVMAADKLQETYNPSSLPQIRPQTQQSVSGDQDSSAPGAGQNRSPEAPDQQSRQSQQPQAGTSPDGSDDQAKTAPASETAEPDGTKTYAPAGGGFTPRPPAAGGADGFVSSPLPPPPAVAATPTVRDNDVEPGEILVVTASMPTAQEAAQVLTRYGLRVIRRRSLAHLGFILSTFRLPEDMAVMEAVQRVRALLPDAWVGANHHYRLQAGTDGPRRYARRLLQWPEKAPACTVGRRIGLVDTDLAVQHPAFAGVQVETRQFLPAGIKPAAADHGTAIAAILIGAAESGFAGLLPQSHLYAAAVFHEGRDQQLTTSERVTLALDWLVGHGVAVINLSLAGEASLILELAVGRVNDKGIQLVAAAGNNSGDRMPVYPAAYPQVIAVTAVDADGAIYEHASQGEYLDFAAPGVDVWTAAGSGGRYVSGTSFAAPYLTAALLLADSSSLREGVRDLGAPGRDAVFGHGLLQFPGCP